jgi:predicted dehydrogenase
MKAAIIGAGLIGKKRGKALKDLGITLKFVADTNHEKAFELAHKYNAIPVGTHESFLNEDLDFVIIATPNKFLYPIAKDCIEHRKSVLIEKPGVAHSQQMYDLLIQSRDMGVCVSVGYNHIFHPAFQEALKRIDLIGRVMYIDAHYGHGGAYLSSDNWRTDPVQHAGDLCDKGSHLINLCLHFLDGNVTNAEGKVKTFYWDKSVEDNTFFTLETSEGQLAHLHTSCTNWRNDFYFGIFGIKGKLEIKGLNGSYGTETLITTLLVKNKIKPSVEIIEYLGEDESWKLEIQNFMDYMWNGSGMIHSPAICTDYLEIIEDIYAQNGATYDFGS